MPITFKASYRVQTRQVRRRRGGALLAATTLLAMAATLLWLDRGFADYTVTGLFWDEAQGTVVNATNTSVPTIEFSTPDGVTHDFKEDYVWLCRASRKFCFVRSFTVGEQLPVVYKSQDPSRAYVHDEALYGSILGFLMDLGLTLLLLLMVFASVWRKPIQASIQFGSDEIDS